jgi:hypothetical protein
MTTLVYRSRLCSALAGGRPWRTCWMCAAVLAGLAFLYCGCGKAERTHVRLSARPSPEQNPRLLAIEAQVGEPREREGLSYRWFSETGECVPQRTESPSTVFSFGEGKTKDRIVVEVWRDDRAVARGELEVTRANEVGSSAVARVPKFEIEMTDTPPYDPRGGPATRAHIGGLVKGDVEAGVVVVIYARAKDIWFVQPFPGVKTSLRSDHSFSNWTHTGSEYAVLVVQLDFHPPDTVTELPLADKDVLAHLVVEGERL